MQGWLIFILVVVLLALLAGAGFYAYTVLYKKRQSSDPSFPSPAPSGPFDWLSSKIQSLKNKRSQTAAGYENNSGYSGLGGARPRGAHGGALDPDEAWDARVGNEADVYGPGGYYEEQELGLRQPTAYSGAGYGASAADRGFEAAPTSGSGAGKDGKSRSRSPGLVGENPFGDDNAASLRSVSPRPLDTRNAAASAAGKPKGGSPDSSPTFERRSMFRENM